MKADRLTFLASLILLIVIAGRLQADVPVLRVEHKSPVLSIAWSPDGKWLATGGKDGTVRIIEPGSGKEIRQFSVGEAVPVLVIAPDSSLLGIVAANQSSLGIWDTANWEDSKNSLGQNLGLTFLSGQFALLNASPGKGIFGFHDGRFVGWLLHEGGSISHFRMSQEIKGGITRVACDGSVSGGCDADGNLHVFGSTAPIQALQVGQARCLNFLPGKGLAAVVNEDSAVHLWDWVQRKKVASLTGLTQLVDRLLASHDGSTLVALTADKLKIVSWDVAQRRNVGRSLMAWGKYRHSPFLPTAN